MTPRGLNFASVESMKRRVMVLAAAAILAAACSKEEATQKTQHAAAKVAQKVQDAFDVSAPLGKPDGPEAAQQRERQRFDQQWRALQSFRAEQAARATQQQAAAAAQQMQINFVTGQKQSFKG